jgi:hypothetical protein
MAITWNTPSGSLGTINEREKQNILLDVSSDTGDYTIEIIAGSIPRGLRIEDRKIVGTPLEVAKATTSKFVVRAKDTNDIGDRTFSITVEGADEPTWATPEGLLPVGPNDTYFVLDNDKVDFQLQVLDPDIPAGDTIEYYIPFNGGSLPPGLSLSKKGRISGFTDPIFSLDYKILSGNFDLNLFDTEPYDLGARPDSGFDTFDFDGATFDYFEETNFPRRLTRYYQFIIAASDGIHEIRRTFQIYVVSESFLRSDNTIMQVATGVFRADNTFYRNPVWITDPDLGIKRANNYVTVFLDVYDPPTLAGLITYQFETVNPEIYAKTIAISLVDRTYLDIEIELDSKGRWSMPKRNQKVAIKDVYDFVDSTLGTYTINRVETLNEAKRQFRIHLDPQLVEKISKNQEIIIGDSSELPPGLTVDTLNGELTGKIPYQPRITQEYKFTVTAKAIYEGEVKASTPRTFTIQIIGEIESGIEWISDTNLGSIAPNINSTFYVDAVSKLRGGTTVFILESGKLPPGLKLITSGEIVGKVNQIGTVELDGLTRFYNDDGSSQLDYTTTTYDSNLTSFDRVYTFVVAARDIFNYTESSKTFQITIDSAADTSYSNLFFKVLQKQSKRIKFNEFINDTSIFDPSLIYRYGDPAFGIQQELKMLMYAGIESKDAYTFVNAMTRNHYNKRLKFGAIKKAVAKNQITQQVEYEVVYVDIIDDLEKNGKSISTLVNLPDKINSPVRISIDNINVDSDIPLASDRDHQRIWPNSIKNMRKRIKSVGKRDRLFLPLWMRSIQEDSFVEPGFVSAMPVCYCKPGKADDLILNIKNSGFDFKIIDFVVDRYQIDNLDTVAGDKYLAFPQRGEKV